MAVPMLRIESPKLAVDVLPEVGGKIGQIRDKLSGREFLVAPRKPLRTIPLDGDWLQYDTSGMDDCFPNIAAGPYPEEKHCSRPQPRALRTRPRPRNGNWGFVHTPGFQSPFQLCQGISRSIQDPGRASEASH